MSHFFADSAAIFRREALRYSRDRAYWIGQLVFPLAVVGFIGFGLNDVVELPSGVDYKGHLASGILMLLVGSGAVGGGFSLIEDRETGFLRALLIAPVARTSIICGKIAARLVASLVLVFVLIGILTFFTPLHLASPVALVTSVAGVTIVFVSMGISLASRLRRLESFRLVAALVTVPLYLFSGIFYPIATLPSAMRLLAYVNPLTYGVDLLRYGLLGVHEFPLVVSMGMMVGLSLLSAAVAVVSFDRSVRR